MFQDAVPDINPIFIHVVDRGYIALLKAAGRKGLGFYPPDPVKLNLLLFLHSPVYLVFELVQLVQVNSRGLSGGALQRGVYSLYYFGFGSGCFLNLLFPFRKYRINIYLFGSVYEFGFS